MRDKLIGYLLKEKERLHKAIWKIDLILGKLKFTEITIDNIIEVVCYYNQLHIDLIHLNTRDRLVLKPRQQAHYFANNLIKKNLADIGIEIGDKDHTTVLHSCKVVNNMIETDKEYRKDIINMLHLLGKNHYKVQKLIKELTIEKRHTKNYN